MSLRLLVPYVGHVAHPYVPRILSNAIMLPVLEESFAIVRKSLKVPFILPMKEG